MKIEIYSKPMFRFSLTEAEVDLLLELSSRHYDGKCKAASQCGGFLYGWKNLFLLPELAGNKRPDSEEISADWHQLDTCLKIMELGVYYKEPTRTIIERLSHNFWSAMQQAKKEVPKWTTIYEGNLPKINQEN